MRSKINIFGVEKTIDRNIDVTVTEDIRKFLGINNKDLVVTYNEEPKSLVRRSKGVNGVHTQNTSPTFRIDVETQEVPEEDLGLVTTPHARHTYPIFRDTDIGVSLYPLKQSRKRSFSLKFRHKSKQYIVSLRDKLSLLTMQHQQVRYHALNYYFGIPEPVLYMLDHFRVLKNTEDELKLDFVSYMNKYTEQGVDVVNANKMYPYKSEIVYREVVSNVLGRVTDTLYEIDYNKEDDYFTIELNYEIWYEKPIMIIAEYPIMIYNNHIDSRYTRLYSHPEGYVPKFGKPGLMWKGAYEVLNHFKNTGIDRRNWLIYPHHDQKLKLHDYSAYIILSQTLLRVENDYNICNVFNIPGIYFKDTFKKYIKQFSNNNTEFGKGLFLFELYRNGERVTNVKLELDETGQLTSDLPLRKKFTYHLVIRILCDLDYLNLDTKNELLNYFRDTYVDKIEENEDKDNIINPFYSPDDPLYYVDEFGNLTDEEGYVCYIDGTRVIEEDKLILGGKKLGVFNGDVNAQVYIDSNGNFINPDGLAIDEDGNVMFDVDGNVIVGTEPSYTWIEDFKYDGPYIESEYLKNQKKHKERHSGGFERGVEQIKENLYATSLIEDYLSMFNISNFDGVNYSLSDIKNILTSITASHISYPKTVNMFTTQVFRKG